MLAENKIYLNKMHGIPTLEMSEGDVGIGKACAVAKPTNGNPVGEFSEKPGIAGGQGKSYDMFDPAKLEKMRAPVKVITL